jgi:DNA-binding transcriptional LysR family regulator
MNKRNQLDALAAFRQIVDKGSFTRAAAELGITQSALSHSIRKLEKSLGQRLLARTTRAVSPTAAGAALLGRLGPAFDEIDLALHELEAGQGQISGPVRLTMGRDAAELLVMPILAEFHLAHPAVQIEISVSDALIDVVEGRFDAGIRLGSKLEQDMISRKLTGDVQPVVVGAPSYFEQYGRPLTPDALGSHLCIGYRMHSAGRIFPWVFQGATGRVEHRDAMQLVFNDGALVRQAAIEGIGLAYLWRHMVRDELESKRLEAVLDDQLSPLPGFYLYYPARDLSPAMAAFADALTQHSRKMFGETL